MTEIEESILKGIQEVKREISLLKSEIELLEDKIQELNEGRNEHSID